MSCMSVLAFVITVWTHKSYSYNLKCPDLSQRIFRAEKCPYATNSHYQCLFVKGKTYDKEFSEGKEFCKGEEIAREGFKYELEPNPQQVDCSPPRYQPFTFTSHELSFCIYDKSGCNEDGQVIANTGSTTSDMECRCDYTRGYMFVTSPKSKCSCIPSKEDCSCYHNSCPEENPIMLADYRCVNKENEPLPELILCPKITHNISQASLQDKRMLSDNEWTTYTKREIPIGITVFLFICILCLFTFTVLKVFSLLPTCRIKYKVTAASKWEGRDGSINVLKGDSVLISATIGSYFRVKRFLWQRSLYEDKYTRPCPYAYSQTDPKNLK